ncbi:hypothetical protein EVAR_19436_1 [Eumeta japonica]|uniref:Uncharacterized protein n=1 Tax=Eumeta variegata TaxID=151549 RepID=A0A4C1TRP1_EUMVA|nr:hypothetical protein EVAR_19436_1 [Eumeta japonica]
MRFGPVHKVLSKTTCLEHNLNVWFHIRDTIRALVDYCAPRDAALSLAIASWSFHARAEAWRRRRTRRGGDGAMGDCFRNLELFGAPLDAVREEIRSEYLRKFYFRMKNSVEEPTWLIWNKKIEVATSGRLPS